MRIVEFKKAVRTQEEYRVPTYITVRLSTDEVGSDAHKAMDYIEVAIRELPEEVTKDE